MKNVTLCVAMLAACASIGCGSEDESGGTGRARFTVWGEEYIEQGIPEAELADGWSVQYDSFLVVLGHVTVATSGGETGAHLEGTQLFDLVTPGPHEVGTTDAIASKTWDAVSYAFAPIDADTRLHASASDDDRKSMQAAQASVLVRGSASKGAVGKTFEWAFPTSVVFADCVAEHDGKETHGVSLPAGGVENVELTIHGDHLFYDDLASPDAVLRFDAMARADDEGDADGVVTREELGAVALVTIAEGSYGTGSASHVDDLDAFVAAQVATLGHFRGEGHCRPETH